MRIAIGSDHAGFEAKEALRARLEADHEVTDCGTVSDDSVDYPDFAQKVAEAVRDGQADRGVLLCGSGVGVCIAANKVRGIRAALAYNVESATLARQHNDAQVVCVGARQFSGEQIQQMVEAFLATDFEGGRHERRIGKINALESD